MQILHDCMDAEGRATHNAIEGGGRVKQEARTEEQLLWSKNLCMRLAATNLGSFADR